MSGYNYGPSAEAGYGGGQSYEMQPQGHQQTLSQDAFLTAVRQLRESTLPTLAQDIHSLRQLQSQPLSTAEYDAQMSNARSNCNDTNDMIRGRLKELYGDASATPAGGLRTTKERQLNAVKQEWKTMMQQMLQTEKETEEMIRRAPGEGGWDEGGSAQTYARPSAAQTALRSLQSRSEQLQKTEQSIAELMHMFQYMDDLVVQQNDTIHQIEQQADQTVDHLVEANKHQTEAIKSARSWRKYKWWCLLVVVLILIAIAVGVAVGVTQARKTTGN